VAAVQRLQLGLLVGQDHQLIGAQAPSLGALLMEVEHADCLAGEVGVAGKEPGAHLPELDHQPVQLSAGEAAERQAVGGRQLAGDRP
jgi:hypothetical protein